MITVCCGLTSIDSPIYAPLRVYEHGRLLLQTERVEDLKPIIGEDVWALWFGPYILRIRDEE
jgi:hypothetical protein